MTAGYVLCEWGCKNWIIRGEMMDLHEKSICLSRMVGCELQCGVKKKAEEWLDVRDHHLKFDCSKRIVKCPYNCGMYNI